jgi:hypothetical protein
MDPCAEENNLSSSAECLSTMLRKVSKVQNARLTLSRSNCRRFGRKLNGLPKGKALDLDGIPGKTNSRAFG